MPIYEFRCKSCHGQFETLCRDYRAEGVRCPHCDSTMPDRLISTFAVNHGVTPCGTRASEAGPSCGSNPMSGGCGRCAH